MNQRPMLDTFELRGIQHIHVDQKKATVTLPVPGMNGSILQNLGTRPARITITGSLSYAENREDVVNLEQLRKTYTQGEPIPFASDITTGTAVKSVIIDTIVIHEKENQPGYFYYHIILTEYTKPVTKKEADKSIAKEADKRQEEVVDDVVNNNGRIEVTVEVADSTEYQFVTVKLEGKTSTGQDIIKETQEQTEGLYVFEDIPSGDYFVKAIKRES